MKVVRATVGGGLGVEDRDEPGFGPGQVRVRVIYAGICGSDLHYVKTGKNGAFTINEPLVLGHEVVGIIEQIGPDVEQDLVPGQHVAIHPASPAPERGSESARYCNLAHGVRYLGSAASDPHTDGGFSELLTVDAEQVYELPSNLPLRRASLAEPLAVAMHAVNQAGPDLQHKRILVAGIGPIGALVISALVDRDVRDITATDLAEYGLELARDLGATHTVQIGKDQDPPEEDFDVIIESSGSPKSLSSALNWVKPGGTIVQLGVLPDGELGIPLAKLVTKEIRLVGSQRFDLEFEASISLLKRNEKLNCVVSHAFDISKAVEAFSIAADPTISSKVLVRFDGSSSSD